MHHRSAFLTLLAIAASTLAVSACSTNAMQRVEDAHAGTSWTTTEAELIAHETPDDSVIYADITPSAGIHCYEGQPATCYTFVDGHLYEREASMSFGGDVSRTYYNAYANELRERHGEPATHTVFKLGDDASCTLVLSEKSARPADHTALILTPDVASGEAQMAFAEGELCAEQRWKTGDRMLTSVSLHPVSGSSQYTVSVYEWTAVPEHHAAYDDHQAAKLAALEAEVDTVSDEIATDGGAQEGVEDLEGSPEDGTAAPEAGTAAPAGETTTP